MIDGKKVLAMIPARGGSKSVKRKNIREVLGRPLISWTIDAAKKSKYIDRLIVSSEDTEIITTAKLLGCDAPFVRPEHLAKDDVPGAFAAVHALEQLPEYDILVFLQPTSPLRETEDIDRAIELSAKHGWSPLASVVETEGSVYWMYWVEEGRPMQALLEHDRINLNRQLLKQAYILNGAVFVATADFVKTKKTFLTEKTIGYVMPRERSLDINGEWDLRILESLLRAEAHAR